MSEKIYYRNHGLLSREFPDSFFRDGAVASGEVLPARVGSWPWTPLDGGFRNFGVSLYRMGPPVDSVAKLPYFSG